MDDIIIMRHNPHAARTASGGVHLRMTHRRAHSSSAPDAIQFGRISPEYVSLPRRAAYIQRCEDGTAFTLDSAENTLLTGTGGARDFFRDSIIRDAASRMPVMVLTASPDIDYGGTDFPGRHIRRITARKFDPGFRPFAGWDDAAAVSCLAAMAANEHITTGPRLDRTIRTLLTLCAGSSDPGRRFAAGDISNLNDLAEMIHSAPAGASEEAALDYLQNDPEASNRCINVLSEFIGMCASDGTAAPWTLPSPGITVIDVAPAGFDGQRTGAMYVQRMLPHIRERLTRERSPLMLVIDRVSDDDLKPFMPLIGYQIATLLVISDSIISLGRDVRGRLTRQVVFRQTDGEAARYWSQKAGERRILQPDWTKTTGKSWQFLSLFPTRTVTSATHHGYIYRPYYEPSYFSGMDEYSGFLFSGGGTESFHRFSCHQAAMLRP